MSGYIRVRYNPAEPTAPDSCGSRGQDNTESYQGCPWSYPRPVRIR